MREPRTSRTSRTGVVRETTARAATLAGGALLAAGSAAPYLTDVATAALWAATYTSAAGVAGAAALWAWTVPTGPVRSYSRVLALGPAVTFAITAGVQSCVSPLWGLALAGAWTAGVWWIRPMRQARVLAARESSLTSIAVATTAADLAPAVSTHPAAIWWAQYVAVEDGPAPATVLIDIDQTGPATMTALIRSTRPRRPVPTIGIEHLSAVLGVPEDQISIGPEPGQGAGVRRLSVGKAASATDPYTHWDQTIAPKAMAGTRLVNVRCFDAETRKEIPL